ncbi:MAG: replication-associated recombination protein A [Syntrophomonadaceae bacterium]
MNLFDQDYSTTKKTYQPLAFRMRPRSLDEIEGQKHLLGKGGALRRAIEKDQLTSMVLFGPPGTGKTSLARLIARHTNSHFDELAAVTSGVNDLRKMASDAQSRYKFYQQKSILFVDEIHRFNKSQQDVLLPFVEDGTLILIGATTENPLYELNNALLSRLKLYVLKTLDENAIAAIVERALNDEERGLGGQDIILDPESLDLIARHAKGDARMALNILETTINSFKQEGPLHITPDLIAQVTGRPLIKYDKTGDFHYDTISAFIKSIRGSDPDAAVFWLAAMIEGGEDPKFIARRLMVHAAEDIGLADPQALNIAASAAAAVQLIGLPEARIPLCEATIYLATAPKSNSVVTAIDQAAAAVKQSKKLQVPAHLADTSHSKAGSLLGKGRGYKYPHSYSGYIKQQYLPDEHRDLQVYHPGDQGYEKTVREFLNSLPNKRPPNK